VLHSRPSLKFMMHYFERKRNDKTYKETIKTSAKLQEVIRPHLKLLLGCHLQTDAAHFFIIRKLLILFLTCLWYLHVGEQFKYTGWILLQKLLSATKLVSNLNFVKSWVTQLTRAGNITATITGLRAVTR